MALCVAGVTPMLLDTQYRMHPDIADLPSRLFYGGKLRSGVPPAERPPPRVSCHGSKFSHSETFSILKHGHSGVESKLLIAIWHSLPCLKRRNLHGRA